MSLTGEDRTSVSLNENGLHQPIFLNILSSVDVTVWEGLGGVALLEEVFTEVEFYGFKGLCSSQGALFLPCNNGSRREL